MESIKSINWKRLGRDDYESDNGRFKVSRLAKALNAYANKDQWMLIDSNEWVNTFDLMRDAKLTAEKINRSPLDRIPYAEAKS